jgi:glutathione S-transferase
MGALEQQLDDQAFLAADGSRLADRHLAPIFAFFSARPESVPILEG